MNDDGISLILSTKEWLQRFGLRASGLDMKSILARVGFKHSNDFDIFLQKPVCSRYGTKFFQKYFSSSGQVYNVMNIPTVLADFEAKLQEKINVLKNRLSWLTTGSRKMFGLILDRNTCVVLCTKPLNISQYNEQVAAFKDLIEDQISKTHSFTFIRASIGLEIFSLRPILTSASTIETCIKWLDGLPMSFESSFQALIDALILASETSGFDSIYLFTDGVSLDRHEDQLLLELSNMSQILNVCCFMSTNKDAFKFLKEIAKIKQGRFHAYTTIVEYNQYKFEGRLKIEKKSLLGIPTESELSPDVIEMCQEIEDANCNLDHVRALLVQQIGNLNKGSRLTASPINKEEVNREHSLRSSVWLKHCGLKSKGLLLKDALAKISFRHDDRLMRPNAHGRRPFSTKFCNNMVHLKWDDGSVVHVHVTEEFYRTYVEKMTSVLALYDRRLKWLSTGSRRIFGNITELKFCIIFDSSQEMSRHFDLLRENFRILFHEQVLQKQRFNLMALNDRALKWHEQPVNTTEENLERAIQWMLKLRCFGKVSTGDTLMKSLPGKDQVSAVYLILNGTPENIKNGTNISKKMRFHTISFNCDDHDTNEYLMDLAGKTGGRFHYYSISDDGEECFGGEDLRLIQNEAEAGNEILSQMTELRNECALVRV